MSHRLDQLAMRRRALTLRSERLRAELAADQQVMLDALNGVDRFYHRARRAAPKVLLVGAGLMLFRLVTRRKPIRTAARNAGFVARALFWVSMARRVMPYVPLVKALWRSRFSQRATAADYAQSAQ